MQFEETKENADLRLAILKRHITVKTRQFRQGQRVASESFAVQSEVTHL